MSKAVLISIKPEWCAKIASGEKTIEVRKTRPKMDTPFKCYIYQTKAHLPGYMAFGGKPADPCGVIGEFVCDEIYDWHCGYDSRYDTNCLVAMTCLDAGELYAYGQGKPLYGWHISELKIYDTPKKLIEFTPCCEFLDGDECPNYLRVGCPYQQIDYNQDASVNVVLCGRRLTCAPQSWCYVEELE